MKVLLNVQYQDKEKVKKLGAKLDHVLKKWFVDTNKTQIVLFAEWLPNSYAHLNKPHVETKYEVDQRIAREANLSKKEISRRKVIEAKQKQKTGKVMSYSVKPKEKKENLYNGEVALWDFSGEFIQCYQ